MADGNIQLQGTMPVYRDLYPSVGAVGEKFIVKKIGGLYRRDCLIILSKLTRHHFKYCQASFGPESNATYRERCLELLSPQTKSLLLQSEAAPGKAYNIIFPELSAAHLIRLCLKHCRRDGYTKVGSAFDGSVLETMGDCLLVVNSIMGERLEQCVGSAVGSDSEMLVVNCTKQLIADSNFALLQKLYQSYFLFNEYLPKHKTIFDADSFFVAKYGVSRAEYFAFLFLVYSQFQITNHLNEDWHAPGLDFEKALVNLKPKFSTNLLNNLLINNVNPKKLGDDIYDVTALTKWPFVKLDDGMVIPLSLRRLFVGLTDSVYFDVLDSLPEDQKLGFMGAFGLAVEDYFRDIVQHIDVNAVPEFKYEKGQKKTVDAMIASKDGLIFLECKKRSFHTVEFMRNGTVTMYYDNLKKFCREPLQQVCNRIADFRSGKYPMAGADRNVVIYPVIVSPAALPLLSGAWDKLALDKFITPDYYSEDGNVQPPEFIDFAELECIEAYLSANPHVSLIDLIKLKRSDTAHHDSNWATILAKNDMAFQNERLTKKYLAAASDFKNLLFEA
jgi:hypothetical protein